MLCLGFVISYANHVYGLSCLVFAYLGFVVSIVCLSRVCDGTNKNSQALIFLKKMVM